MTREPDRFEAKANELLITINPFHVPSLAAALRQAADEALERAAQRIAWIQPEYTAREAQRQIRALASPAATPAAEHTLDCYHAGARAAAEGIEDPGCTCDAAPPSEPVAPADVCRAEVSSRFPDYSHYECTLRKGHAGPHKEGSFAEWTDATTFEEPPAP